MARPRNGNSDLISNWQARTEIREQGPGSGVRLNTYSDSIGSGKARRRRRTSLDLPAPRSNAAARSRNTQQSTQGLSIQDDDGSRLTGRGRRTGPVLGGLAAGAEAPKSFIHSKVMSGTAGRSPFVFHLFGRRKPADLVARLVSLARFLVGQYPHTVASCRRQGT